MNPVEKHTMISFDEAQRTVLDRAVQGAETVDLPVFETVGHVLAERIQSIIDMPAFNRASMDGFVFRHADHAQGDIFRIAGTIAAGSHWQKQLARGECVQIMTGAPIPAQADTVIPVEETSLLDAMVDAEAQGSDRVRFHSIPPRGAHVAVQGEDVRVGDTVLDTGHLIRPQGVSILAGMGRRSVKVYRGPSIAFAATGEELVEPGKHLGRDQIYNSNAYCVWSQILLAKARPHYLGVIRDNTTELRKKISKGLKHDMLVLSGGVSMGKLDFVPEVFEELGVEIFFRKLLVKPGKPTVFGMRGKTLVFGLPGNPVSTLYAFDQYVTPAIRAFRRHPQPQPARYTGELTETVTKKDGRLLLVPCLSEWRDGTYLLTPLQTHGSADIFHVAGADVLAIIPAGIEEAKKGEVVGFRKLCES